MSDTPSLLTTRLTTGSNPWIPLSDVEFHSHTKELGRGGFGVVKRGTYRGQEVAIKSISLQDKDENFNSMAAAELLMGEANKMMSLDHPRIVKFVGFILETCSLVLEYMPKGGLDTYISKHPELSWNSRVTIAMDISEAMAFLHSKQRPDGRKKAEVYHQDLKSGNVLLTIEQGILRAKISDFGMSVMKNKAMGKQADASSFVRHVGGTQLYMAPELFRSSKFSKACDVYSFGVVLLELMTLQNPSVALEHYPENIAEMEHAPQGFRTLTELCLNLEPSARPSFDVALAMLKNQDKGTNTLSRRPEHGSHQPLSHSDTHKSVSSLKMTDSPRQPRATTKDSRMQSTILRSARSDLKETSEFNSFTTSIMDSKDDLFDGRSVKSGKTYYSNHKRIHHMKKIDKIPWYHTKKFKVASIIAMLFVFMICSIVLVKVLILTPQTTETSNVSGLHMSVSPSSSLSSTTKTTTKSPTPTLVCSRVYVVQDSDSCLSIIDTQTDNTITLEQLIAWNYPLVDASCSNLMVGQKLCLSAPSSSVSRTTTRPTGTTTSTSTSKTSSVTPTAPPSCLSYYTVKMYDACDTIAFVIYKGAFTIEELKSWNPSINEGCTNLWIGAKLCINALIPTATTTATATPTCTNTFTVTTGDTCDGILRYYLGGTLDYQDFLSLNPKVNPDCTNLYVGQMLCIGTFPMCASKTYYQVAKGDTCATICQDALKGALTVTQLKALNPQIDSQCSNLKEGWKLCL